MSVRNVTQAMVELQAPMSISRWPGKEDEPVRVTADHLFYVESQGWVPAGELRATDMIYNFSNIMHSDLSVRVTEVAPAGPTKTVYNLFPENSHTYFVGERGFLAHACGGLNYDTQFKAASFRARRLLFASLPRAIVFDAFADVISLIDEGTLVGDGNVLVPRALRTSPSLSDWSEPIGVVAGKYLAVLDTKEGRIALIDLAKVQQAPSDASNDKDSANIAALSFALQSSVQPLTGIALPSGHIVVSYFLERILEVYTYSEAADGSPMLAKASALELGALAGTLGQRFVGPSGFANCGENRLCVLESPRAQELADTQNGVLHVFRVSGAALEPLEALALPSGLSNPTKLHVEPTSSYLLTAGNKEGKGSGLVRVNLDSETTRFGRPIYLPMAAWRAYSLGDGLLAVLPYSGSSIAIVSTKIEEVLCVLRYEAHTFVNLDRPASGQWADLAIEVRSNHALHDLFPLPGNRFGVVDAQTRAVIVVSRAGDCNFAVEESYTLSGVAFAQKVVLV